jgi:hypothetical protein
MANPAGGFWSALTYPVRAPYSGLRRMLTGGPSSVTHDTHVAWLEEQLRASATARLYAGPLTGDTNLTGETWEIRQAYRRMLKEPAVYTPLLSRTLAVASLDPQVLPEDKDDPVHRDSAKFLDWSVRNSRGGWLSVLFNTLFPGQMDGFSLCEKTWCVVPREHPRYGGRWTLAALKSKDTEHVQFDLDVYRNVTAIRSSVGGQAGTRFDPGDFVHFVHMKLFESPTGLSALRPAYRAAQMIATALRLRDVVLKNYSGPFLALKHRRNDQMKAIAEVLNNARANGWISLEPGDELQVLNLATSAPDQFQQAIEDLRKELFLTIRGAYLQALESKSSQGDSATHADETNRFDWYLAELAGQVLTEQLAPDLVTANYGTRGGRPRITLGGVDLNRAKAWAELATSVKALVPISAAQVYERTGVEPPRDASDAVGGSAVAGVTGGTALVGGADVRIQQSG